MAGAYLETESHNPIFDRLRSSYKVLFKDTILRGYVTRQELIANRELYAAFDYDVCQQADVFIENNVSTFSPLTYSRKVISLCSTL